MAKEFKRSDNKDFKGKKSFGKKAGKGKSSPEKPFFKRDKESRSEDNFNEEKPNESKKSRADKRDDKPAFERYRDDSKPSDFGSTVKREKTTFGGFKKKRFDEKPLFNKRSSDDSEKPSFREKREEKPKSFGKKPFSGKPTFSKTHSKAANPYDLDEKDFEYGKPKPSYEGNKGGDFKKKPYEKKPYQKKVYSSRPPSAAKPQKDTDDGTIRLNKYIANAGICSRREADALISSGVVQVNGKNITEMGYKVKPTDIVKYGGQTLKKERMVYLILNKPKDYITTSDDPQKRKTVLELIQGACKERIYPVGRLDRATTGLLMFTNDGELTKKLTHPSHGVRKVYHVELDKPLKHSDLEKISAGIELEDGEIKVDEVTYIGDGSDKTQVGVEIHSGKNRIVRRIFEHMGYNVRKLDRVIFGSLTKKDLPRGRWRLLNDSEVGMLKMISSH
jgi:23S rRNA pseudouridine2605 synthase